MKTKMKMNPIDTWNEEIAESLVGKQILIYGIREKYPYRGAYHCTTVESAEDFAPDIFDTGAIHYGKITHFLPLGEIS